MLLQLTKNIDLDRLLQRFRKTTLLVVGDIVVDEFIWGKVSRISPEAPVPVVAVSNETLLLGGAANVVNNVHSLGARVLLTGIIGNDAMGDMLRKLLTEREIDLEGLVVDTQRPTTVKTRVIAHSQQVVRFDREKLAPIHAQCQQKLLDYIGSHWEDVDGIIISDYGKGVVTPALMKFMRDKSRTDGKLIAVDPRMNSVELYKGVTVVTPNSTEAEIAAGKQITNLDSLVEVGGDLLERFASRAVLVTRGEEGMVLFERGGKITNVPTVAREVFDVTGAGDTVISALTLALAAGSDFPQAAVLANYAAGIVVGKVGTATVTPAELKSVVADHLHP